VFVQNIVHKVYITLNTMLCKSTDEQAGAIFSLRLVDIILKGVASSSGAVRSEALLLTSNLIVTKKFRTVLLESGVVDTIYQVIFIAILCS
jgi:hypothetical protein